MRNIRGTRRTDKLHWNEMIESRTRQLNRRDLVTVAGARFQLQRGAQFHVDHQPLFWVADIVAGAVRAYREGQPGYRQHLADCACEVDVATDR